MLLAHAHRGIIRKFVQPGVADTVHIQRARLILRNPFGENSLLVIKNKLACAGGMLLHVNSIA